MKNTITKEKLCRIIPEFDHFRLLSKVMVNKYTGCWEWFAHLDRDGYGKIKIHNSTYMAHRASYFIFRGQPSQYKVIDHGCRNRKCCNPDHLIEVDVVTNTLENSLSPSSYNKRKSRCKNGHEFTEENTCRDSEGYRACLICRINYKKDNDIKTKEYMKNYRLSRKLKYAK